MLLFFFLHFEALSAQSRLRNGSSKNWKYYFLGKGFFFLFMHDLFVLRTGGARSYIVIVVTPSLTLRFVSKYSQKVISTSAHGWAARTHEWWTCRKSSALHWLKVNSSKFPVLATTQCGKGKEKQNMVWKILESSLREIIDKRKYWRSIAHCRFLVFV